MLAIQLAIGLAAVLLVAGVFVRGGALAGALTLLLAGSCFGHPFYHVPVYPIPITADRALCAGLVLYYLVCRWRGVAQPKPMRRADWLLLGMIGVVLFSTFTHDWSIKNNQPVSDVLFQWLMPAAVYWVVRQSQVTKKQVLWLLGGLAAFGLYLSVTAYLEVHGQWSSVFPSYIGDAKKYPEYFGRGRGPFLNPTANGMVLTMCWCAAWLAWPHLRRGGQLAVLLVSPIYAIGVLYTLTRSVWMGVAAAVVAVAAVCVPRHWRWRLVATACLAIGVLASTSWEHFLSFKRDKNVSAFEVADSVQLRPILAVVAWNMFRDRPLLGCGYGQYDRAMPHYLADRSTGLPLEKARRYVQHNTFLALLTQLGVIGLGLFASLFVCWTGDAWRLWRRRSLPLWARQFGLMFLALMATFVTNGMFHDLLPCPMATMLLCTLAGAVASLGAASAARPAWGREQDSVRQPSAVPTAELCASVTMKQCI